MFKMTVEGVFKIGSARTAVSGPCENKYEFKKTLQDDKGNVYHDVAQEVFVKYLQAESIATHDQRTSLLLKGSYRREDLMGRILNSVVAVDDV